MGAKAKIVESAVDALGKPIGALADYLKEFDPRTFYHGSISPDIKEFGSREDFIHFGSQDAAQQRLEDMRFMEDQGAVDDVVGSIYPVKLRATNSLPLKEEKTSGFYKWKGWNVDDIWDRISMDLGITGVTGPTKKKKLIAKEKYNLDWFPIEYEILNYHEMIGAMAYTGLPTHYRHWSFGKSFERTITRYNLGMEGLPYEMIINSNPSIAYLMLENPMSTHLLTMSHCVGHSDFFKNNRMFTHTDPDNVIARFKAAGKRVQQYIEDPNIVIDKVERILDGCHVQQYKIPSWSLIHISEPTRPY